jgi:hypothetical protein
MALTCSLLGHAYGEGTVERDREERGSEVVLTIKEYETCRRCGTTRVVSENTEVTAVEADAAATAEDRDTAAPGNPVEGAEPADSRDSETAPTAEPDAGDGTTDAEEPATPADPAAEDAEIMDAEAGAPVDEELAEPSVTAEDVEESPPAAADDDAVVIDDTDEGRAPGEWPEEEADEPETEWTPPEDVDEGPDIERSPGQTITVPEGEFHCEECGYSTPVDSSSLRAGDFCPECHRGTLQHVREE